MGAFSVLNNLPGIAAQNQLVNNNISLSQTLLRLSSGKRINSGADDAAGLGIADNLRANVRALNQAIRNANDGISVAQIADGALSELTNLLTRAFTLAEQAATDTVDATGRTAIHNDFLSIQAEMARIADQVNFNGVKLFSASGLNGALSVFVGDTASSSSISVTVNVITTAGDKVTRFKTGGTDISAVALDTKTDAASALSTLRLALLDISSSRAAIGAGINRLQSAVAVLQNQSQNTQAAESTIRDANMAEEVANMAKYQILAQSGIAALSQANANSQLVLALLRQ